jgi:hypothetical protein
MRQGEGNMRALLLGLAITVLGVPAWSSAEFVWVDANGRVIGPYVATLFYADDEGLIWLLDPETATLSTFNFNEEPWLYTEPDCQGPAYLTPIAYPRSVFTTHNCSVPRVRRDGLASQQIHFLSRGFGALCFPLEGTGSLIPESEMIAVERPPPDLGACPPLHVERR